MDNYYSDYRVRNANSDNKFKSVNEKKMTAVIEIDEEDLEVEVKYEVCDVCEGKGRHVNPSIDCDGLTSADFDSDPYFREDYFGGFYDVTCYCCHGNRVILEIDREKTSEDILKRIDKYFAEIAEYKRIQAAERRMGA